MAKKKKEEKQEKKSNKPATKFKQWMAEQGITQKEIRERTAFGTGTTCRLVNDGEASESIKRHLALELGLPLNELKKLLKTKK